MSNNTIFLKSIKNKTTGTFFLTLLFELLFSEVLNYVSQSHHEELNKAGNLSKEASKILGSKKRRRNSDISIEDNQMFSSKSNETLKHFYEVFDGEIDINSNYTGYLEIIGIVYFDVKLFFFIEHFT